MPGDPEPVPDSNYAPAFQPGQTFIFIGDHTSPDDPGYVAVISTVLARFHPHLKLNLISAGSRGQSASGLRSPAMLQVLTSSRPDWLVAGIGLADAAREPDAARLLKEHRENAEREDKVLEATFGPEYRSKFYGSQPESDSGYEPALFTLTRLADFSRNYSEALTQLSAAGVRPILLTTTLFDNDLDNPANQVLGAYNKAIRELAREQELPLVDVERAFIAVHDRAANYKQRAQLMGPDGRLLPQGQSLLARTFLGTFGLLPGPGFGRNARGS